MIDNSLSPEEQAIIRQIQSTPRLEISPAARMTIRERMLNEFRAVSPQNVANTAAQTRLLVLTTTAIIVITIVVIIVLAIIASQNPTPENATATPVPSASPQAQVITTIASTPLVTTQATSTQPRNTATRIVSPTQPTQMAVNTVYVVTAAPETSTAESSLPPSPETATQETVALPVETTVEATPESASVPATATTASATQTASITPPALLSATIAPTQNTVIVIEGPVINIVNNIITVYDFDIEVDPNHPILNLIEIGDVVHIEGAYGSTGAVVATIVSNLSSAPLVDGATVSLDGPVESINGTIIVVNGISVQLAADDPLLQTVQVGQFVRVQGNFQQSSSTFVLVVVNIATVNVNTGGTNNGGTSGDNSNCVWKENGMSGMGKWKCSKGMGMGDD